MGNLLLNQFWTLWKGSEKSQNAEKLAETNLKIIGYDFTQFTIEGFIQWLEKMENITIELVPIKFPPNIFGAWTKDFDDENHHYIFYDYTTPLFHQIHIILHELGHYVCGHEAAKIKQEEWANLSAFEAYLEANQFQSPAFYRAPDDSEQEQEAELFATLIQKTALRYVALEKMFTPTDDAHRTYLKSLGVI